MNERYVVIEHDTVTDRTHFLVVDTVEKVVMDWSYIRSAAEQARADIEADPQLASVIRGEM